MDETYQVYLNRVARQTHPDTYRSQVQNLQESPKFKEGQPLPFPGYTINTPGEADAANQLFYQNLQQAQTELVTLLGEDLLIALPSEILHFTVGDLIWDTAYRHAVTNNPNFEKQLCGCLAQSFRQYEEMEPERSPIQLQLLGLLLRPRSIGVVLAPIDEPSFGRLMQLRRAIYQNPDLIALGVEQQYPFTAHITLGYFNAIPSPLDRAQLCEQLLSFNDRWIGTQPQILRSSQAALYQFGDMTHFEHRPSFPLVTF
ncbi:MAG: DUF1868 domain-containing protein [Spirulina sp. SIO3F2]|nr:DUF1868 domain-containing protein [Spirulina sp. SIO3F2]